MPPAPNNNELIRNQILAELEQRYFSTIPSRLTNRPEEEQRRDRFSRALAAFVIQKLSNCDDASSAAAIVDCGDDNGIDAVYYSRRTNTLYLVQAKFGNAPDRADTQLFIKGVSDLLAERYDQFRVSGRNLEFDRVQPDIEDALQDVATHVVAIVVYLENSLGQHAINDLNQLQITQNERKNWFRWQEVGAEMLLAWFAEENAIQALTIDLTLEQWSLVNEPRRAVYGQVTISQLQALYQAHGNRLFQNNIRFFLGDQGVNSVIVQTIKDEPAELFYLNNGITAICQHFDFPGNITQRTTFRLSSFSIVNGAQTVGAIDRGLQAGQDGKLLVTIIEVGPGEQSGNLTQRITRTRNTQNSVNVQDFIALDPNQERLRQELAISNVSYYYRPSAETIDSYGNSFTFTDAAIALACFSGFRLETENEKRTSIIVATKREIGQVYDRNGQWYRRLFRHDLSGAQLFRWVQIYRYMNEILSNAEITSVGRKQAFLRHGRYFILHIWARNHQEMLNKPELTLSNDGKLQISDDIIGLSERIYSVAEPLFAGSDKGYLKIFRNLTDVEQLDMAVMRDLHPPVAA